MNWRGRERIPSSIGGDPLLPGKAAELRAHSDSRDLCPACVDTDELVEVKTNMAMRPKTISLIGCIHGGVRSPYSG